MAKKHLHIVESATPPIPPPERSPERQALAEALAKKAEAVAALAALVRAGEENAEKYVAADNRVEEAKKSLADAARGRSAALVAQALGQIPDANAEMNAASAALAAAEAERDTVAEVSTALRNAMKEVRFSLGTAETIVAGAVDKAIATDPAVAAVLAEFEKVKVTYANLFAVISTLEMMRHLPVGSSEIRNVNTAAYLEPWLRSFHALGSNPDHRLPSV